MKWLNLFWAPGIPIALILLIRLFCFVAGVPYDIEAGYFAVTIAAIVGLPIGAILTFVMVGSKE